MRANEFTTEARRNPEQNPKTSINAVLKKYLDQAEQLPGVPLSNLFVSFTQIEKLGINPQSEYSTPIGIYAYPVDYVISKTKKNKTMDELPFTGHMPWANIFRVNPKANIIVLQQVTNATLDLYIDRIKKELLTDLGIKDNWFGFGRLLRSVKSMSNSPGQILWAITGRLGDSKSINGPVGWNEVCRNLGIDGFIDLGDGIIHPNEPTQAVFFKSTDDVIQMLDRVDNKYSPNWIAGKQQAGEKIKAVKQNTRRLVLSILAGNPMDVAVKKLLDLAPYDIKYLVYVPKNIRLEILKRNPDLLLRLAVTRTNHQVDADEVLAATNSNPDQFAKFQQTFIAKWMHPNDRERLKNMGYDFTPLYEGVKL
jgi:hypothetical protein